MPTNKLGYAPTTISPDGFDGPQVSEVYFGEVQVGRETVPYTLEHPSYDNKLKDNGLILIVNGLQLGQVHYSQLRHEVSTLGRACLTVNPDSKTTNLSEPLQPLVNSYLEVLDQVSEINDLTVDLDWKKLDLVGHSLGTAIATRMAGTDLVVRSLMAISGVGTELRVHPLKMASRIFPFGSNLLFRAVVSGNLEEVADVSELALNQANRFLRSPIAYLTEAAVATSVSNVDELVRLSEEKGIKLSAILCEGDELVRAKRFHPNLESIMEGRVHREPEDHLGPLNGHNPIRFAELIVGETTEYDPIAA